MSARATQLFFVCWMLFTGMAAETLKAQTGSPGAGTTGAAYDLTIADRATVVSVQPMAGGQKIVTFNSSVLNGIAGNFTILQFENLYPQSRFAHLRNLWRIQVSGNTLAFLNALHNAAPGIFKDWNLVETPVPCYTPNDYHKGFWSSGYLETINARTAWDYSKGSGNTIIGVTDTYFDPNNPDLAGKFAQVSLITSSAWRNHGTHVAGLIAGGTDNDTGFAAIGFNCRLHAEDYFRGNAINYEMSLINNRRIINASWSTTLNSGAYRARDEDLYSEMYENGTFMVAAAGNGYHAQNIPSTRLLYPASYDHVFSVTGCNWILGNPVATVGGHSEVRTDSLKTQQHNERVDLMAPSFHIGGLISEDNNATGMWRWFNDGGLHGTSFAAPLVAGTAGLMIDTMPCLTPYQLEYILKKTAQTGYLTLAENMPYAGKLGAGGLDAGKAVMTTLDIAPYNDSVDACNDPDSRTLYIKGFEFTSACAPGFATNGHLPQLSAIIENGTPPCRYRWQPLDSNTVVLDDSSAAAPTIVSSTANAAGRHMAHYRLTVYDNSDVPKTAKRFLLLPLHTAQNWDLALRDSYMDVCDEPNRQFIRNARDWQIWESPDLWVRQTADGQTEPQTPEWTAGSPNTIYTRIRNIGCAAFDSTANPNTRFDIYWTKASTGERWPGDWDGQTLVSRYGGGSIPAGGHIGNNLKISSLAPGQATLIAQNWQPTDPRLFAPTNPGDPAPEAVDICLLGRLANDWWPNDLTIAEIWNANVKYNVNNNNNIVTRNLIVQNKIPGRPGPRRFVDIANAGGEAGKFTLELINEKAINKHFSGDYAALGTVRLSLGSLYDRWQAGGGRAEGHFYKDAERRQLVWDGTGSIRLKNITLAAGERFTTDVDFLLRSDVAMPSTSFTFHLRQFVEESSDPYSAQNPEGNVSFVVRTGGSDADVAARPDGGSALPGIMNPSVIGEGWKVYPNPATDAVVVERSVAAGAATILLYDLLGRRVREASLADGASKVTLNTGGLSSGLYTLKIHQAGGKVEIRKLTLQTR